MAYKEFVDLTTLYAADVNDLMSQTVARFDALTERDAAIPGPDYGQMCYTPTRGLQISNGHEWCPAPGTVIARLRRTSTSPVATNAAISWDDETFDTYLGHSLTVDPTRYICPVDGKYTVTGSVHHGVIAPLGV